MKQVVGSRKAVLALVVALVMVAAACSNGGSPTAPVATESSPTLTQATAADVRDDVVRLWAIVMKAPEMVLEGDRPWVRLEVECRHSEYGPSSIAVFRCEGGLLDGCAGLKPSSEILALARYAGMDGRDRCPMWNVTRFRMVD